MPPCFANAPDRSHSAHLGEHWQQRQLRFPRLECKLLEHSIIAKLKTVPRAIAGLEVLV